jgi:cytochrome P450
VLTSDLYFATGDSSRDVTMEDVNKLKYTDCFIKETLRLYPPVSLYARETGEDCVIGTCLGPTGKV